MNVGVYRIYNVDLSREGEPFSMCDEHYKEWYDKVGYKFIVNKIANDSISPCEYCQ